MSNVGGVSNAGPVNVASVIGGGGLTIDALMLHCASQLNHLDDQIQAQMTKQNVAREQQEKLGKARAMVSGSMNDGSPDQVKQTVLAFKTAYDSLPPGDPGRDEVRKAFNKFVETTCFANNGATRQAAEGTYNLDNINDGTLNDLADLHTKTGKEGAVSADEMKEVAGYLDSVMSSVGKGAELDMINLQSMVSKRQMAIQITTQLISKMNESAQSIIQQIK